MTRLLLTLVLASFLFTAAHADEASDYVNANMTWADNIDFHRLSDAQAGASLSDVNANMLWSDNSDFHRINTSQADHDWINANMIWSDDHEFQAH